MLQTISERADGGRKMGLKVACLGIKTGEGQQSRAQDFAGDGRIHTVS